MRISDWSSDVCSSDLPQLGEDFAHFLGDEGHQVDHLLGAARELRAQLLVLRADADRAGVRMALAHHDAAHRDEAQRADAIFLGAEDRGDHDVAPGLEPARSEEHTSELQSLMRISY